MLNLNSNINLDFKTFLHWWRRELGFLVPEKIQQLFNDKRGYVVVSPEGNQLILTYVHGELSENLAKIDRNGAGIAHYKSLKESDERLAKANVILRLTARDAVQKELSLPVAAKENLHQVVAYELDRYTPFKAEQVYFAVKAIEGSQDPDQIRVMLVLTTREVLDGLVEDLNALEMSPVFADYEGLPNRLDQGYRSYNLLPEWLRQKSANTPRLIHAGLIASVVVLLVTALVMPVWLAYQSVGELEKKVVTIEKDAKKIKALQAEVDTVINETQKLLDEKNAKPSVLEMLNRLSTIIKDDTWLAYLQYSDGHLQIQGESPAASTLIAVLEESDIFSKARFVSPVTQNNISKLERFQITVDVNKAGGAVGNP